MNNPEILCILPVYNEQENIKRIVDELRNLDLVIDFVMIDDGSDDSSYNIAKQLSVNIIRHIENLGVGSVVQTGCRYAIENNYSYIIRLDGDGQHDPKSIRKIVKCLVDDSADVVIGTRYYQGSQYKKQFWNTLGARYFSLLIWMKTKWKITDPASGFIGMKRDIASVLIQYLPQDYPEIESILITHNLGYRLKEIPINMYRRKHGKSSITFLKRIKYIVKKTLSVLFFRLQKEST